MKLLFTFSGEDLINKLQVNIQRFEAELRKGEVGSELFPTVNTAGVHSTAAPHLTLCRFTAAPRLALCRFVIERVKKNESYDLTWEECINLFLVPGYSDHLFSE